MSQENVEIVREVMGAWNRRDLERMNEICSEEMEWVPANPGALEGTVYRGRAEVLKGWETTWETWEEFQFEERETRDLGDSVLWLGSVRARGRASDVALDQEISNYISLRDGKIIRSMSFLSWQQGLEAAGLAE
jgi:ketosteroid isomerase-like protein